MDKKLGLLVVGLFAIFVVFLFLSQVNTSSKQVSVDKTPVQSEQPAAVIQQEANKDNAADSLRNALQGVVQDSIEKDIQDAVQSEVEKSQK